MLATAALAAPSSPRLPDRTASHASSRLAGRAVVLNPLQWSFAGIRCASRATCGVCPRQAAISSGWRSADVGVDQGRWRELESGRWPWSTIRKFLALRPGGRRGPTAAPRSCHARRPVARSNLRVVAREASRNRGNWVAAACWPSIPGHRRHMTDRDGRVVGGSLCVSAEAVTSVSRRCAQWVRRHVLASPSHWRAARCGPGDQTRGVGFVRICTARQAGVERQGDTWWRSIVGPRFVPRGLIV